MSIEHLRVWIPGIPKPAGSKKAFPIFKGKGDSRKWVSNAVVDACDKSKDWKQTVRYAIAQHIREYPSEVYGQIWDSPLWVKFCFHMPRLKAHYRKSRGVVSLKPNAPNRPVVKPDLLKLARGAEDAMTGVVYRDDSQIVIEQLEKVYAELPGVEIVVMLHPERGQQQL
jgi:Holliday junction resolvase RusA-like endonuclease